MLDAITQIQLCTRNKTLVDFSSDRLLQDAVVRNFEILGEASRKLLDSEPDAASKFPGIPFTAIYAMRNQLSHGYFTIDLDIVWKVIERDIPNLQNGLQSAIAALDEGFA